MKRKIKKNLQCMTTETIFKSYMKPFVASQDPENLISAKFTLLSDLQHSSDCKLCCALCLLMSAVLLITTGLFMATVKIAIYLPPNANEA